MKTIMLLTADDTNTESLLIQKATGGKYSHCAIGFMGDVLGQKVEYFESWKGSGEAGSRSGLRGPLPISKLMKWVEEDELNHRLKTSEIWMSPEQGTTAYKYLLSMTGHIAYSEMDIALSFAAVVLPVRIARKYASRGYWTCSEAFARAMPANIQIKALEVGEVTYDCIIPSGDKLPSVENGITLWNQAHGLII